MARYLSPEWFSEAGAVPAASTADGLTLEQVVEGAPGGSVVYRVVVAGGAPRIVWPVCDGSPPADLRITCDWPTAVAIAKGELSTERALVAGRLRVSGDAHRLPAEGGDLGGVDPVPEAVRQATTYGNE
jgi:hypothetical protein